ncbi:hypothetical protein [Acinetobacter sp. ANC 3813]|uniref:hypothetical protein n=1 Tax=Acinetobacter sp. ANC 3813 TaxID=1977873 RepID=UPI000A350E21|nr:hypothetical protein [Acinetobacter sp. ANC 3813]OTG91943.1 hypothetical protein B9T34_00920 [Acinetobacter sp. ANC 3813]
MKEKIFALIILFGGLILSITSFNDSRDYSKVEKRGIDVMSEPMTQYAERTKRGAVVGYNISPRFKAKDGAMYTCHGDVAKAVIDRLRDNPVIKVRYLLNSPEVCMIEGQNTKNFWFLMTIGLMMILGSAAYIYNRSNL